MPELLRKEYIYESHKTSPPYDGSQARPVAMERITKYSDFGMPEHDKRLRTLRIKALCYSLSKGMGRGYILGNAKTTFPLNIQIFADYQDSNLDENYWDIQIPISSDKTVYEVSIPKEIRGRAFRFDIWENTITGENEYMVLQELAVRYEINEEKYAP